MSSYKDSSYQNPFSLNDPREKPRNYWDKPSNETKNDENNNAQSARASGTGPRFYENPYRNQHKNQNDDEDDWKSSRTDKVDSGNADSSGKGNTSDSKENSKSSKSSYRNHEPENMRYYHLFNLKREPYRLRHYMYYSNDINLDFHVENYNKLGVKQGKPPQVRHYMRYYDMKFENELDPRGKHYGSFYTLTDDNQSQNVVHNREYKGFYSRQLDYLNFKLAMSQEKQSVGK